MDRQKLNIRFSKLIDKEGVKVSHVAEKTHIPPNALYNMRSGVQETLSGEYAISLHEYLSERGY